MTVQSARPEALGPRELEFATFHEGYISRYIQLADAKAGSALVVVAATLGYLLGTDKFVSAISFEASSSRSILAAVTLLSLAASGCLSFFVIAPRGTRPRRSLVYWSDVARIPVAEFVEAVQSEGADGIARERLEHAHAIAGICARKYRWLRVALIVGAVGVAGSLVCRMVLR